MPEHKGKCESVEKVRNQVDRSGFDAGSIRDGEPRPALTRLMQYLHRPLRVTP